MDSTRAVINLDINTGDAASNLRSLQSQLNGFMSALNKANSVQAYASKNATQQMLELVNASRFFTAETIKMQTAASQLDKTLSKGQVTMGQFLGAKFQRNSAAAAQVLSLANARAASLETQFIATGRAANGMREAIAVRPLQAFNRDAIVSAEKLAIHRAMLNQATTSMINFGKNTQWAGRQLMVGFTVPLTIFAATAGKTFREIEKELVNFKKVYGDAFTTPEELNRNIEAVKGLASEYTKYGIAAKDTLALAAQAAAAGAKNGDLIDATAQSTRLATLGQMEQNDALQTTIALQNAFALSGKELSKSINFLNMVENQTVVTLQDLSAAIPRVAPVIKGLGGSVEDMAAMLAAMQEGGVSAEQGANALKSGLASLINPTDRAVEKLQGMGIALNSIVSANKGDLMGTVQDFARALKSLDEFGRQQALETVFGKFQYARLGALFDNIVKDGSQAQRVLELTGMSAAEMAASAEKELGAIEQSVGTKFVAAVEKLKLAIVPIGELFTKMAIPVINFLTSIVDKFNSLPDFAKNFLGLATVVTGLVIPAGTMFLGLLMNLIGTLTKFGSIIGIGFKGFLSGGIKGAISAVNQSLKYMALAELDASNASQQLAGTTTAVNNALLAQVGAAEGAQAGILELAGAYEILTRQMQEAALQQPVAFGVPAAAMGNAANQQRNRFRNARNRVSRAFGGTIPGSGNTDKVPAMLTPGEFVVNKQSTQKNLGLLEAINGGAVSGYNNGGMLPRGTVQHFAAINPVRIVQPLQSRAEAMGARSIGMGLTATSRPSTRMGRSIDPQAWSRAKSISSMPQNLVDDINNAFAEELKLLGIDVSVADPRYIRDLSYGVAAIDKDLNNDLRLGKANLSQLISNHERRGVDNPYRPLFETDFVSSALGGRSSAIIAQNAIDENMRYMLRVEERRRRIAGLPSNEVSDRDYSRLTKRAFERSGQKDLWKLLESEKGTRRTGMETDNPIRSQINYGAVLERAAEKLGLGIQKRTTAPTATGGGRSQYIITDSDGNTYKLTQGETRNLPGKASYQKIAAGQMPAGTVRAHFMNSGGQVSTGKNFYGRFNAKTIELFTRWISSQPDAIASMKAGAISDPIMAAMFKGGFRRSKGAETLQRATWMKNLPKPGDTISLGALASFSPKGTPVIQHLQDSKVRKDAEAAAMWLGLDQRKQKEDAIKLRKILETGPENMPSWAPERKHRSPRTGETGINAWIEDKKWAIQSRKEDIRKNKAILRDYGSLTPTIIELDTPSGTIRANLDDIVSAQNQTYMGKSTSEKERILHNAIIKVLGIDESGSTKTLKARLISSEYPGFNNGGFISPTLRANQGNIVPGTGNTDTVPAMLTPGEFVVNKKSTQSNMALLQAINGGKVSGYALGGIVEAEPGQWLVEGRDGRTYGPYNDKRTAKAQASRLKRASGSRTARIRSGMSSMSGMRGMGIGMGASMAGGAMMMAAGSMPNEGLANAMSVGGTALSFASMVPMIAPMLAPLAAIAVPATAVAGVLGAVAAGLYIWRNTMDEGARAAADFGAELGGTANALNQISTLMGEQTPAARSAQLQMGVTAQEQAVMQSAEFQNIFTSEAGQKFIEDLKGATSADRFEKLSDYLRAGIAAGVMDQTTAQAFGKGIAAQIGDVVLGSQVSTAIRSQGTGAEAYANLAEERLAKVGQDSAISALRNQDQVSSKEASQAIGGAIQVIQDFANAEALAREQFAQGIIDSEQMSAVVQQSRNAQAEYTKVIQDAMSKTGDFGSTMQATKDQLIKAGLLNEEQFANLESAAKKTVVGSRGYSTQVLDKNLLGAATSAIAAGMSQPIAQEITDLIAKNEGGIAKTYEANLQKMGAAAAFELAGAVSEISKSVVMPDKVQGVKGSRTIAGEDRMINLVTNFVNEGGDPAEFQAWLASIPSSKQVTILTVLEGFTPQQQIQYIADAQKLGSTVGAELGQKIQDSQAYKTALTGTGTGGITAAFAKATEAGVDQKVLEYAITTTANGEPVDLEAKTKQLTEATTEISSLPEDMVKGLKIDITAPKDLERFGPMAKQLKDNWTLLENLNPNIDIVAAAEFLTIGPDGQPLTPDEAASNVIKLNKAWKNLSSGKAEVRKQAMIDISTAYAGKAAEDGLVNPAKVIDKLRSEFKNFDKLDPIVAEQMIQIQTQMEVENAEDMAALLDAKAKGDAAIARGDFTSATGYYQQVAQLQSAINKRTEQAKAQLKVTKSTDTGKNTGGGGGGGEKTLMQELRAQAKMSNKFIEQTMAMQGPDYKRFISGPFAPEFIEYLRSQGERGLKIIKGGLDKVRQAYSLFVADKSSQLAAQAMTLPFTLANQLKTQKQDFAFRKSLIDQGFTTEQTRDIADQTKEYRIQIEANKELIKQEMKKAKAGRDTALIERLRRENDLLNKGVSATIKFAKEFGKLNEKEKNFEAFNTAMEGMNEELKKLSAQAGLVATGVGSELAGAMADAGLSASSSEKDLKAFADRFREIKVLGATIDPIGFSLQGLQIQSEILANNERIAQLKKDIAIQEVVEPLQKELATYEKQNDQLSRTIELRQRALEPIDDSIDKLEEEKTKIEESYDTQLEALDAILNMEESLLAVRERNLDVADALSRGDISSAAKAAIEVQKEIAKQTATDQRAVLEKQRQAEIEAVDTKINNLRDQRKVIEDDIKNLQLQQRSIQDNIYNKQQFINSEIARLETLYGVGKSALEQLKNELAQAVLKQNELNAAAAEYNRIKNQVTPVSTATTTPTQTSTSTAAPQQMILPGFGIVAVASTPKTKGTSATQQNPYGGMAGVFGIVPKFANGGRVGYKGSNERPPGFANGGTPFGSDSINAMLTPGEFVVRRSAAEAYGPLLESINSNVFPRANFKSAMPKSSADKSGSMYNYNVNVTLNGANMNPDDVANAVMQKIKMKDNMSVRSYNYRGN